MPRSSVTFKIPDGLDLWEVVKVWKEKLGYHATSNRLCYGKGCCPCKSCPEGSEEGEERCYTSKCMCGTQSPNKVKISKQGLSVTVEVWLEVNYLSVGCCYICGYRREMSVESGGFLLVVPRDEARYNANLLMQALGVPDDDLIP